MGKFIQVLSSKLPTTWHSELYDSDFAKVGKPKSNILVIQTPICEYYVVRFGYEIKYQEDMCLYEIGLV
jgi:hypothetical protein